MNKEALRELSQDTANVVVDLLRIRKVKLAVKLVVFEVQVVRHVDQKDYLLERALAPGATKRDILAALKYDNRVKHLRNRMEVLNAEIEGAFAA
jgi:hypothetical protein